MIKRISRGKELSVVVTNAVGALAKMMSFLVNHGINVEAVTGYSNHSGDTGAYFTPTKHSALMNC